MASCSVTKPFLASVNISNINLLPEAVNILANSLASLPTAVSICFCTSLGAFLIISETSSPKLFGITATPSPACFFSSWVSTFMDLYSPWNLSKMAAIDLGFIGVTLTPLEPYLVVNFLPKWFIKTSANLAVCTSTDSPLIVVNSFLTSFNNALSALPSYKSGTPIIFIISLPASAISWSVKTFSFIAVVPDPVTPGLTNFFVTVVTALANLPATKIWSSNVPAVCLNSAITLKP